MSGVGHDEQSRLEGNQAPTTARSGIAAPNIRNTWLVHVAGWKPPCEQARLPVSASHLSALGSHFAHRSYHLVSGVAEAE